MKPFTIIDQIIFEMDYRTGCWRKLRRRIRMADRRSNFNGDFISDDGRVLNANGDEIPSVYLSNNSSSNSRQSAESSSGVHGPARNYGNSTDVQNRSLRAFDNLFSRPAGGSLATENAETVAAAPSNGTTPPFRISRPVITSQPLSAIPTNTPLSIQRSSVRRNTVDNSRISGSQSASLNDFAVDRTSWLPWAGEPVMERRPAMAGGLAMAQADNTAATTDKPSYEQQQQPPAAGSRMNNHIGNAIGR
jgi:hypothetical protein